MNNLINHPQFRMAILLSSLMLIYMPNQKITAIIFQEYCNPLRVKKNIYQQIPGILNTVYSIYLKTDMFYMVTRQFVLNRYSKTFIVNTIKMLMSKKPLLKLDQHQLLSRSCIKMLRISFSIYREILILSNRNNLSPSNSLVTSISIRDSLLTRLQILQTYAHICQQQLISLNSILRNTVPVVSLSIRGLIR